MKNSKNAPTKKAAVNREMNKRLADYRSAATMKKKFQAINALSLLALISSVPDETQAARLLKLLKTIDKDSRGPKQI